MFPQLAGLHALHRSWWALAVRGGSAMLFGAVALLWPALTLWGLVVLFAAYALADGAAAIIGGVQARWWGLVAVGVLSGLAGGVALAWPDIGAYTLLYLIAAWAIVRGAADIAAAVQLREVLEDEWLLVLGGAASIAFGVLVAAFPLAGALSVVWLLGAYAFVFGALVIGVALRVRANASVRLRRAAAVRPAPRARRRDRVGSSR